jgi:hypothetical protein
MSSVDGRKLMADAKFYESYSRWLDNENRYETWNESVKRVMDMHRQKYESKMTPVLSEAIDFCEELYKKKAVLGAQRALQFGGEQLLKNNLKLFNCFSKDTRFITDVGIKSFLDFKEGDEITVLTHKGNWKKAIVKSYGEQILNEVNFNTSVPSKFREKTVRVTGDHRWILKGNVETTSLQVGDILTYVEGIPFNYEDSDPFEKLYWCYGYVYGDGTCVKNSEGINTHSMVRLCRQGKDVEKYAPRFSEVGFCTSTNLSLGGDMFAYTGKYLKTSPKITDNKGLFKAFIRGYLDADGTKNGSRKDEEVNRYVYLQSSDIDHIEFFRDYSCLGGVYVTGEQDLTGEVTNFAKNGRKHTIKFHIRESIKGKGAWQVTGIKENVSTETVWCLEVEDDKSFMLEGGIPTGNCVSSHLNRPAFFGEYMELLLSGCGAGFSVQKQHIEQLPSLKPRNKAAKTFVADDSIEGWAEAFDVLFSSFFVGGGKHPEYAGHPVFIDLKNIRPKGAMISGGFKAPGPEPLRKALDHVEVILNKVANEKRKLKSIEAYDCCMHMADAVLAGGIRRSATICLFSKDDEDMIKAKTGDWFISNPQRGRSNNSAMLLRNETSFEEFQKIMESVQHSGDPGFIWTDNLEFTYNPCVNI